MRGENEARMMKRHTTDLVVGCGVGSVRNRYAKSRTISGEKQSFWSLSGYLNNPLICGAYDKQRQK